MIILKRDGNSLKKVLSFPKNAAQAEEKTCPGFEDAQTPKKE